MPNVRSAVALHKATASYTRLFDPCALEMHDTRAVLNRHIHYAPTKPGDCPKRRKLAVNQFAPTIHNIIHWPSANDRRRSNPQIAVRVGANSAFCERRHVVGQIPEGGPHCHIWCHIRRATPCASATASPPSGPSRSSARTSARAPPCLRNPVECVLPRFHGGVDERFLTRVGHWLPVERDLRRR